jgi:hypothetical protein
VPQKHLYFSPIQITFFCFRVSCRGILSSLFIYQNIFEIHNISCVYSILPFKLLGISLIYKYKLFIHSLYPFSSMDGHLGCFQICSIMNKAAMIIFISWINWWVIGQLYVEFYNNYQTFLYLLHSHQQCANSTYSITSALFFYCQSFWL